MINHRLPTFPKMAVRISSMITSCVRRSKMDWYKRGN